MALPPCPISALFAWKAKTLPSFCRASSPRISSCSAWTGFKRSTTEVLLVCSRDLLAPTLKRLSMFVLRAKAKLTDATADFALYGVTGEAVHSIAGGAQPAWAKADVGSATVVHLYPADDHPRALWVAPVSEAPPAGPALDPALWLWSEVRSGVATLTSPVVEAFVPQMLNYESVGGVNFKKGCYPGQEVVARSQFRGTLKRRAFIAHAAANVAAGADVFAASDLEQPCGTVVQVAPAPGGGATACPSPWRLCPTRCSKTFEGMAQTGQAHDPIDPARLIPEIRYRSS